MAWAFASLNASSGARAFYDRQCAKGTDHNDALRRLANRLVGILHRCLKAAPSSDPWSLAIRLPLIGYGQLVAPNGTSLTDRHGSGPAVRGSVAERRNAGLLYAPVVAASYCWTTLAGMRPRSLTAMPWSFAHARIWPLRSRLDAVRVGRRRCPRPALRACSM